MYEWREEQYEAKLRASGERLKQMTAAESCGKDSRSIQVWLSCHISPLSREELHDCLTDLRNFLSSWLPPEAFMFATALKLLHRETGVERSAEARTRSEKLCTERGAAHSGSWHPPAPAQKARHGQRQVHSCPALQNH
jgi:hypothetical protein